MIDFTHEHGCHVYMPWDASCTCRVGQVNALLEEIVRWNGPRGEWTRKIKALQRPRRDAADRMGRASGDFLTLGY